MMQIITWLLSRVELVKDGQEDLDNLFNNYKYEALDENFKPMKFITEFAKYIPRVFPNVRPERKLVNNTRTSIYNGIKLKTLKVIICNSSNIFSNLQSFLPNNFKVKEKNDNKLVAECISECISNGSPVMKTVTFLNNGTWQLNIAGKEIDLLSLKIHDKFDYNKESISVVCSTVCKLRLCQGVTIGSSVVCSRYHVLESWKDERHPNNNSQKKLRSIICLRAVSFISYTDSCRICQKMTFQSKNDLKMQTLVQENKKDVNNNEPISNKVSKEDFKKLIPNATDEMLELLLHQAKNSSRDSRGRRWSKQIISICLQLFSRSPLAYTTLRASNFLILPSPEALILYKNSVNHKVGFQKEIFQWMFKEAKRLEIPEEGWVGGIILDEMAIQEDLQIHKQGDEIELVGFLDLGEEGNICSTLKSGKNHKVLGTHILQFVFLGTTGFRFPFAHFVSNNVQATEVHTLFWDAVDQLQMYGFRVVFTCMDGASSNRSFMHINIDSHLNTPSMLVSNLCCFDEHVVFIMDYSHVVKKIRNNILKSGIRKGCTRNLTLQSSETIQWQMWTDCYHWDQNNALQIHRRLTNEHIFPSSQNKMRNHLAEEVLNEDMHHLFEQYQAYLGQKGCVLNGAIQLLKQTAQLIRIFRDRRPITSTNDERLNELLLVLRWFTEWKGWVTNNDSLSKTEKNHHLMSYQCIEDIQSCIIGFMELCQLLIQDSRYKNVLITPALTNSDVIENEFNQQRSTFNGANTNPNCLQYRKTLNNIILGQSVISKKANAGKVIKAAESYALENPNIPLRNRKKRKREHQCFVKPIKVIRL